MSPKITEGQIKEAAAKLDAIQKERPGTFDHRVAWDTWWHLRQEFLRERGL